MGTAGAGADVSDVAFANAISIVLRYEGGLVDHSSDSGGITKYGISKRSYPDLDIRNLLLSEVIPIYRRDFWTPCRCDDWPYPVALVVFDTAVNCGPGRAKRWLQKAAGVVPDKVLGPVTARAVLAGSPVTLASEVLAHRLGYYMTLGTHEAFGFGWARRVLDIQREALK